MSPNRPEDVRITVGGVSTQYRVGTYLLARNPNPEAVPLYVVNRDFHIMPERAIHSAEVLDTLIRLGVIAPMKAGVFEIDFTKGTAFQCSTQTIQMQAVNAHKE